MTRTTASRQVLAIALAWMVAASSAAQITLLGPTPYLSRADSPFPVDGSHPNFFLEDFEDGELNTPGILQVNHVNPILGSTVGVIRPPSPDTDSVDSDDGAIDGLGAGGFSMRSATHLVTPTLPPGNQFIMAFDFDKEMLGYLPNAFGFVWTDGLPPSSLGLLITTADGATIESQAIGELGDAHRNGTIDDDRFVGVQLNRGIRSIRILGGYRGEIPGFDFFEIDHVQYGLLVPEPGKGFSLFVILFGIYCGRNRHEESQMRDRVTGGPACVDWERHPLRLCRH